MVTNLQHKHAGIVLAAGASSRMGSPKALLPMPDGTPLALHQAERLRRAGASDVVIVLGCGAEAIAPALEGHGFLVAYNAAWETGRLSSLQAGLRAAGPARGALVLPVDTVGVRVETLTAIFQQADPSAAMAVRPYFQGKPGRILWIAHAGFEALTGLTPDPTFRLDAWIKKDETRIDVDDPAILHNINTPEAWRKVMVKD